MSHLRQVMAFAAALQREHAVTRFDGYIRRDPLARLGLGPGRRDPYAIYDQLRAGGTLVATRRGNFCTTSHRVCSSVLRDRRFLVRLDDDPQVNQMQMSFLTRNPPDHTRLRRLAQPAFSPKAMAGYTPRIEATIGTLLDKAAQAGEFDMVSAFAGAVPIAVITDLLGIPDADSAYFARIGAIIGSALGGIQSLRHARQLQESRMALGKLFEGLFELRRKEPRDDIVSHLVAAEGTDIHPMEMRPMCTLLLVAGFETTVNLIGNSVLALTSHRDQWEELCADPAGLAPRVVDEVLRYDPPVQMTSRLANEPVELEGTVVKRGQQVLTLIGGANRDPEAYERPGEFDIHREGGTDHLAFSSGIHYCLGKPLALLEARLAIQALAERMPGLALAGPVQRRNSTVIRGPVSMPVTAGARRAVQAAAATAQPAPVQPATVQPATVQPATVQPATVQPATVQPATVQPADVQPVTVQPVTVEPVTVEPVTVQPVTVEPVTVEPVTVEPAAVEPAAVEPAAPASAAG